MNSTSIENKPQIYEVPTLLVKRQIPTIEKQEATSVLQIYIQYDFDNNLNNSEDSEYLLTLSGTIRYNTDPISVYLDESSYLSTDIDFDIKTLSFWFKSDNSYNNTYLLTTNDNNFYIQANSNELNIKVNTDISNITHDFIANSWYHLALTYNESESEYDIYINKSILPEKIDNLITNPITLNIGKISGVFGNDSYFTGNIADLRLYNYSNADITTIYTEFYNTIP